MSNNKGLWYTSEQMTRPKEDVAMEQIELLSVGKWAKYIVGARSQLIRRGSPSGYQPDAGVQVRITRRDAECKAVVDILS